ncbi:MAG: hypothetical protein DRJ65_17690 [Acidobacteria bacterium]|nr:MAG: hypothetical protein DRJ65_17690 [Acidobacteriota bacterium]
MRWQGRCLQGEDAAFEELCSACSNGMGAAVPLNFLLSGQVLADCRQNVKHSQGPDMCERWAALSAHKFEVERFNRQGLQAVGREISRRGQDDGHAVFLGDIAVLLGLYGSLAAFPARLWAVGLHDHGDGEESVTEQAIKTLPDNVQFGRLGRLERVGGEYLEKAEAGQFKFRIPTGQLLVVLLAARVGEPEASLESPTWAHLMIALTALGSRFDLESTLALAQQLGCAERVHRGFAIVRLYCEDIAKLIPAKSLTIPLWERMALRIAASRMMREAVDGETVGGVNGWMPMRSVAV